MEPSTTAPASMPASAPVQSRIEGPIVLFKLAWTLFKAHWKILVSIIALPYVFLYAGQLMFLAHSTLLSIVGFILAVVGIVYSIALYPALADAVRSLDTNPSKSVTVSGQYKVGFSLFWSVILVIIIATCISLGSFLLLIIPGIVVTVYASTYIFTFVLEGKRGYSAFTESYSLVKGRWWGVFGRALFLVLITVIPYIIGGLFILILSLVFGFGQMSIGYSIISIVVNFFEAIFIGAFSISYAYKLYLSLKATRLPSVSTSGFKKWLVAFTVLGPILAIVMFVGGVALIALTGFNAVRQDAQFQQMYDQNKWKNPGMPSGGTTPYTDSSGMMQVNRPGGAGY